MASVRRVGFSRDLARLFGAGTVAGLGEGQLLDRFAVDGDEVAFEALVARHGPMVLGVCRRSLRDEHAAEDAFQATFLVLARKAGTLRRPDRLGPWLHGVARKVSARSRAVAARREAREARAGVPDAVDLPPDADLQRRAVAAAIHDEIARLPESYRAPIVLCSLQGLSHDEAARHLAWPVGTVRGRLARARALLKSRLARRGFGLAAGGLATELSSASAAVSPAFIAATAALAASARLGSAGMIPAAVSFLSHGVLSAMYYDKLIKLAALGAMALGLSAAGAGVLAEQGPPAPEPTPPAVKAISKTAEATKDQPKLGVAGQSDSATNASVIAGADDESKATALDEAKIELEILEVGVQDARERMDLALRSLRSFSERPEVLHDKIKEPKPGISPVELENLENANNLIIEDIQRIESERRNNAIALERMFRDSKNKFHNFSLEFARRKREVAALEERLASSRTTDRPIQLSPPRKIRPGDLIHVELREEPPGLPSSANVLVKGDGTIHLGFYGEIPVAGLTRHAAKERIVIHLKKFMNDEMLGLSITRPDTTKQAIKPADSGRVFVDNLSESPPSRGVGNYDNIEERLDRIERILQTRSAKDR